MEYQAGNITIHVEKDYDAMSRKGARIMAAQLFSKPNSTIGLATGGTPVGMYNELVRMCREGIVDFSEVTTFNLDEYYPIGRDNEQSYFYFMEQNLFSRVNIDHGRINIPNGECGDAEEECSSYERKLHAAGGLDIQLLGIGNNGHIAFNEPGEYFEPLTHVVSLDHNTIEANARFFKSADEVPPRAISMGIRSILSAKKILLLANGSAKSDIIADMVLGKITPSLPASILQVHHDVTLVITEDAAGFVKSIRQ